MSAFPRKFTADGGVFDRSFTVEEDGSEPEAAALDFSEAGNSMYLALLEDI